MRATVAMKTTVITMATHTSVFGGISSPLGRSSAKV